MKASSTSGPTKLKSVTPALFVLRLVKLVVMVVVVMVVMNTITMTMTMMMTMITMKIMIMTQMFAANLAALLVPDGQPLLDRDG